MSASAASADSAVTSAPKRPRVDSSSVDFSIFSPALFETDAYRKELHEQYNNAVPYRFFVIDKPFKHDFLLQARNEIRDHLSNQLKETDIYKVFQTGDFANIDGLDEAERAKLTHILKLRNGLYSKEFRKLVEDVTGCGELNEVVDSHSNLHAPGCHLVCHDDVIGDRRISYILYMTDPDEGWCEADGGALELYPTISPGTPAVRPSSFLLPHWNTMAMFVVEPGVSFHSVQEVFSKTKTRASIQGWFHSSVAVPTTDMASLSQIVDAGKAFAQSLEWKSLSVSHGEETLTSEDISYLSAWINPKLLDAKLLTNANGVFATEKSLQMKSFLKAEISKKILKLLIKQDEDDHLGEYRHPQYAAGVHNGWKEVGPPHIQRYLTLGKVESDNELDNILHKLRCEVFASSAFAKFLFALTKQHVARVTSEIRRFRPGMDYSLAQNLYLDFATIEATLCFVDDSKGEKKQLWESEDVGGYDCCMAGGEDEQGTDATVYKAAKPSDVKLQTPVTNMLCLMQRDSKQLRFIKNISIAAPSSRWDIANIFA